MIACQCDDFSTWGKSSEFAVAHGDSCTLRQGLWTEDLRIPPGQECSNGSLILRAVVLWRSFLYRAPVLSLTKLEQIHRLFMSYETR